MGFSPPWVLEVRMWAKAHPTVPKRISLLAGVEAHNIVGFDRSPIGFDPPLFDVVMKGRPRPIREARNVPVFHRIEVRVFDVAPEVVHISDAVFPIPALPHADLAFSPSRRVRLAM